MIGRACIVSLQGGIDEAGFREIPGSQRSFKIELANLGVDEVFQRALPVVLIRLDVQVLLEPPILRMISKLVLNRIASKKNQ